MPAFRCRQNGVIGMCLLSAAAGAGDELSGRVVLSAAPAKGFAVHDDRFGYVAGGGADLRQFPAIEFDVIEDGEYLLPVGHGLRDVGHPHWEVVLRPGHIWHEDGEEGGRTALPIALIERNANCTHNGVLSWEFDDAGQMSEALWQITLETCGYFRFDMYGVADGHFVPDRVAAAETARRSFRANLEARLPVVPIERIGERFPGIGAAAFGATGDMKPEGMTVYGFVVDGVHYRSGCKARWGNYPLCDELPLPSYSTAKSIFAGLALMRLEKLFPGSAERTIASLVPACDTDDWRGVTIEQALDMATGNYRDTGLEVDEASDAHVEFLYAESHAEKIGIACTLFPRREEPGTRFVYHTSDTYVAGTAMRALLEQEAGEAVDLYETLLVEPLWDELLLSSIARETRTTYDGIRQPLVGWGLTFIPDDVARIANWLNAERALIGGGAMLDDELFAGAMQQNSRDRGLPAPSAAFRYNNGFWAHDIAGYIGCAHPVWVPFMSGYGGISIVLFPNGTTYYYFSDGYTQRWREAALASHSIRGMCEGRAR